MRTQRYLLWLPGALQDGSTPGFPATSGTWPRQSVDTVAIELDFIAQGYTPVGANSIFQLTLDDVVQSGNYTLNDGLKIGENNVASPSGLTVPASVFLGLTCTQAAGASDIAAWITETTSDEVDSTSPWYAPTLADFQARVCSPELEKYTAAVLQTGQPDAITSILAQTVDYVYGFVSKGGFKMGLKGTLPREVVPIALDLAKETLFKRTASLNSFSETMRLICQNLREELKRIAEGDYSVSMPVDVASGGMQRTGTAQVVRAAIPTRFSACKLDGLN